MTSILSVWQSGQFICSFVCLALISYQKQYLLLSDTLKHLPPVLQMFPTALVCGNTYVMKPSEQDPGAAMLLTELAQQAGVPDGVLNVIHGQKECLYSASL